MIAVKETIVKKIEQYENIAIFFHELPDLDALGSSYGLQYFLKTKYPSKDVRIIGLDTLSTQFQNGLYQFDKRHVPNEFLANSLGIILDTANASRIWSGRQNYCRELIRIDHHPKLETIADFEWVDDSYCATAEMIAELLFEWDYKSILIPTCNSLYAGLLTDTGRFLYPSVTPKTYAIAAKLIDKGCNRQKVHDAIYLKDVDRVKFTTYVFRKAHFDRQLGMVWAKLGKNSFDRYGVKLRMSMVHVLSNIKGMNIWFTFYYDNVVKQWKGSIRSAKLPINHIAEKYHGGGHKLAAGVTIYKRKEFKMIIEDIREYLRQNIPQNK
ncbi:MAG: DHH family phosphoesterase [Mycoplasmoidaceae bacterium]